jgi:hypothetical protein
MGWVPERTKLYIKPDKFCECTQDKFESKLEKILRNKAEITFLLEQVAEEYGMTPEQWARFDKYTKDV